MNELLSRAQPWKVRGGYKSTLKILWTQQFDSHLSMEDTSNDLMMTSQAVILKKVPRCKPECSLAALPCYTATCQGPLYAWVFMPPHQFNYGSDEPDSALCKMGLKVVISSTSIWQTSYFPRRNQQPGQPWRLYLDLASKTLAHL